MHNLTGNGINMGNLQQAILEIKEVKKRNLQVLDLSGKDLTFEDLQQLMPKIQELTGLKQLLLGNNRLTALPEELGHLRTLEVLNLDNNQLGSLPLSIGNLTAIRELELSNNNLRSLPDTMGSLIHLEKLDISNNEFTVLPEVVGNLSGLKELFLESNELNSLPPFLGGLLQLRELFAGVNRIETVSGEIGQMTQIRHIDLRLNQIEMLPEAIGGLTQLEEIDLSGNPLTEETRNWLNHTFEQGRFITDMAAFDGVGSVEKVLEKIYGEHAEEQLRQLNEVPQGSFSTAVADNQTAQKILKTFLEKIPVEDKLAPEIFIPAAKHHLDLILLPETTAEDRDTHIQKIATALGNCATPVKSFLLQTYVGLQVNKEGAMSELLQNIIQREAVEESIQLNLKAQLSRNETIEQVQGLVNSLFLENAENNGNNKIKITGVRSRLPSKTNYIDFAFNQVTDSLATGFASMCCKTDTKGQPIKIGDKFIIDTSKLQAITESYLKDIGVVSEREKRIHQYETEMQSLLQSEEFCSIHFQEKDVQEVLDIQEQKKELRNLLMNTYNKNINEVLSRYLENQKLKIESLRKKYAPKQLAGLTEPVNQSKRDRSPSPDSSSERKMPSKKTKDNSQRNKQIR